MITKLGKDLCKEAGITHNLGRKVWSILKKTKPEYVKKPFEWAYRGTKKPAELAVRGITRTGKFIHDHPHSAIPAAAIGLYGAAKMKDTVQKNYLHTDPQMRVTRRSATNSNVIPGLLAPKIEYRDPQFKQHFRNRNLIY